MGKKNELPVLEQSLLQTMHALEQQIARAMERSPGEREREGVQKWGPYGAKIEQVCSLVLENFGGREQALDSLLVLSQAFAKSVKLLVHELGAEGLGEMRSRYVQAACEDIAKDAEDALRELRDPGQSGLLS